MSSTTAVSFSGADHDFFTRAKAEELVRLAGLHLGDPGELTALDVGCGVGLTDRHLAGRFATLIGTDVSPGVLETAARANPGVRYELAERDRLPFPDGKFDLAFAVCVVQVLPPAERPRFVAELARVTRPGGLVVVFEHNPLNPLTRLVVRRCEFGEDAKMLRMAEAERLLDEKRRGARRSRLHAPLPVAAQARPRRRASPSPASAGRPVLRRRPPPAVDSRLDAPQRPRAVGRRPLLPRAGGTSTRRRAARERASWPRESRTSSCWSRTTGTAAADLTPREAESFAAEHSDVVVVARPKEGAMGWDLRSGLDAARGDYLVYLDGDGQVPTDAALEVYRRLKESGADVAKGRRYVREDGSVRTRDVARLQRRCSASSSGRGASGT